MALVLVAVAAVLYAAGVRRLADRGRQWPATRTAAFAGGLAALAVAALPPLATHDTDRFSVHMTQHLLIGMVAPVGLAMGAPVTLALQAASRRSQVSVLRLVKSAPVAALTHPVVGWLLFGGSLFGLYLSPLFGLSLRNGVVHEAVHLHFVIVGCVFVWPLVGIDPVRWRLPHGARLLSVLLAIPVHTFLGLALLQSDVILGDGPWTPRDQRAGAGLLWAAGDVLAGAAAVVVFLQWAARDQRRRGQGRPSVARGHQPPCRRGGTGLVGRVDALGHEPFESLLVGRFQQQAPVAAVDRRRSPRRTVECEVVEPLPA